MLLLSQQCEETVQVSDPNDSSLPEWEELPPSGFQAPRFAESWADDSAEKVSPGARALLRQLGVDPVIAYGNARALDKLGASTPYSPLEVMPATLRIAATRIPDSIARLAENKLEHIVQPTSVDRRVRIMFWDEYERAFAEKGRPMNEHRLTSGTGAMDWSRYEVSLTTDEHKLAWFLTPPASYQMYLREAQELGLKRLTDIMSLPLYATDKEGKPTGPPSLKVAIMQLAALKYIDSRLMGAVTQKFVGVSLTQAMPETSPGESAVLSRDAIDARIQALERELESKSGG